MSELLLHPLTKRQINNFVSDPSHAVILSGPTGSGKLSLALELSGRLLNVPPEKVQTHAYAKIISLTDSASGGIEAVRDLEHFLSLKVPGSRDVNRVVILEDSHLLSVQAQNALLKTLEEPPAGTVLILTAAHEQALLPTILSRAQQIMVKRPETDSLRTLFENLGFESSKITQAFAMSGGLPGLTQALLSDAEHPLQPAVLKARELLSQSTYERLAQLDSLSKQRVLCQDTLFIMQQMAHFSLQTATGAVAKRWQAILAASYEASTALLNSGQPKLVLTDFLLRI